MSARDLPLHDTPHDALHALLNQAAGVVSRVDAQARVEPGVQLGAGCRVRCAAFIARGTRLGRGVVVGAHAVFADDEDGVGPTTVGDGVHIGAGAVIDAGLHLGAGARVKPGAVVLASVAAGAVVAGNPAVVVGHVDTGLPARNGARARRGAGAD